MDWTSAYDNSAAVKGSAEFFQTWTAAAEAFRADCLATDSATLDIAYGEDVRQKFDLFRPRGVDPIGLLVHVHGGYWMRTDKSVWSHFATGALARGLAVAMPSYRLCPDVSIATITADVSAAITQAASHIAGPIVLSGHSAGGHLVTRQLCRNAPLGEETALRIRAAASISGLHDLRPLIKTPLNDTLQLSVPTARAESPALLEPRPEASLYAWVGADELPELRRQTALLSTIWHGQLAHTQATEIENTHHFDVIDSLCNADSPILDHLVKHLD